jgi:hypothetical protein
MTGGKLPKRLIDEAYEQVPGDGTCVRCHARRVTSFLLNPIVVGRHRCRSDKA